MHFIHMHPFAALASILFLGSPSIVCGQTIVELAQGADNLKTLVTAVTTAELVGYLSEPDAELTVFAPTDDAFAELPDGLVDKLLTENYRAHLVRLLSHHLLDQVVYSTEITDGLVVDSLLAPLVPLQVAPLTFSLVDGDVLISGRGFNASRVVAANLNATNGVVHVVDGVFVPEVICCVSMYAGIQTVATLSTVASLIEDAGLADIVDTAELTIFGPPNAVFEAIGDGALDGVNVTAVLLNHVVLGPPLTAAMLAKGMNITTYVSYDEK
eukprot:scaffold449_cov184-Amphora_coffeaeformis.AAC.2